MAELHWTEVGRNSFSLVRDVALVGLLGGLVFYPSAVGARLDQAGITKGSAFGIEFERKAREIKDQSVAALEQTEKAGEELKRTETALTLAKQQIETLETNNPQVASETADIKAGLEVSSNRVDQVQANIAKTITRQQNVVDSQSALLRDFVIMREAEAKK